MIWTDILAEMEKVPPSTVTKEDALEALKIGVILAPTMCAFGHEVARSVFVKLAAITVRGIELIDAEMEAEADDEIPF